MLFSTIPSLIEAQSENRPNCEAIVGLKDLSLNYYPLFGQLQETLSFLNSKGIGRNDPVAIILPNGPIMATAFLSIASCAASAPLNPSYTATEYKFYLDDLQAKAIIVQADSDSSVIQVAKDLNIPIIYLHARNKGTTGLFNFSTSMPASQANKSGVAKMSDIALILHTSGTTSRPKMVPLRHKNLCTSALNICKTLKLTSEDRCLNIMPLFHIHGLMAAILASITAGASVACTPGFYSPMFYEWLDLFKPTWYTAVPTMHEGILSRAPDNIDIITRNSLRFIRSSSASLPPSVMLNIEKTFGVPIIEAYGMTEASHQIACNPLPPEIRKPGSVGLPSGPEVAIMEEENSTLLPKNQLGEIVIRGNNVTLGYMNNEEANQKSFINGWFRTGDQGYIDEDGYIFLTGRLKEMINRGGEKISPREVDEVLLSHQGVAQAVTFGIDDGFLGEDIAAAVVIDDPDINENDLKKHVAIRLAPHKIPKRIVFLDEIPKGPTGKLQRINLAEQLGLKLKRESKRKISVEYEPPQTDIEKTICDIWQETLNYLKVGIYTPFRDLGGDSMLATLIHQELETIFQVNISLVELYESNTVSEQAKLIERYLK